MSTEKQINGMLAQFDAPGDLLEAAKKLRDAGYKKFDCYSPIHGMDDAMGLKRSPLGWIVGGVAFVAFTAGLGLEWWTSTIDYPIRISGKPYFSYQAYGPVAFAVMVLSSAFTAFLGMLGLNKLPQFYHSVFHSDRFASASDDGFFVEIEAGDVKFSAEETKKFLEQIGGKNVEVLQEA